MRARPPYVTRGYRLNAEISYCWCEERKNIALTILRNEYRNPCPIFRHRTRDRDREHYLQYNARAYVNRCAHVHRNNNNNNIIIVNSPRVGVKKKTSRRTVKSSAGLFSSPASPHSRAIARRFAADRRAGSPSAAFSAERFSRDGTVSRAYAYACSARDALFDAVCTARETERLRLYRHAGVQTTDVSRV